MRQLSSPHIESRALVNVFGQIELGDKPKLIATFVNISLFVMARVDISGLIPFHFIENQNC